MKKFMTCSLFLLSVLVFVGSLHARSTTTIGGKPLGVQGYISQMFQFSTRGDNWDTEEDLNASLTNLFLEADYKINSDWSLYGAGMLSFDSIYQIKDGDSSWDRKQFDKSKGELNVDNEWWQLVKEFHVTWDPGDFFLRLGKQRVGWGEMEVFAVNDLFNPTDMTRGFSELELETLFIPIPLIRTEYGFDMDAGVFSDLNVQFIVNLNPDFIGNQGTFYGNDAAGVWAVDIVDTSSPDPYMWYRLGRQDVDLDEPDSFDSDGFEYGLKFSSLINYNTLFSLMGFTGKANTPVSTFGAAFADDAFTVFDDDGLPILNVSDTGFYPDQKYLGFALASQLPFKISSLGGFEPVFRLEGSYQFDNNYFDFTTYDYVETDQIVLGMNFDYKIKVPWQNKFISIFYETQYNKLKDYESSWDISTASIYRDAYFSHYALISTGYFRGEWEPSFSWYALDNANVQISTPGLTYYYSDSWKFTLKANFFRGSDIQEWGFENKDNIVFKIQYQF